ncbi:MAG: hypothetical protein LRY38_03385 [Aeromonadaceae bacterium]|nr:hypothetical protein [Aeromonadaceae bacterium]
MKNLPRLSCLLLLSSLTAATAAPDNKGRQPPGSWQPDGIPSAHWDDREYSWWQHNCLDLSLGEVRLTLNCQAYDKKYRDHYNRSLNSGNNPGKGHDKGKKQP